MICERRENPNRDTAAVMREYIYILNKKETRFEASKHRDAKDIQFVRARVCQVQSSFLPSAD